MMNLVFEGNITCCHVDSIETRPQAGQFRVQIPVGAIFFCFAQTCRPGPTQLLIEWILGLFMRELHGLAVKLNTSSSAQVKNR